MCILPTINTRKKNTSLTYIPHITSRQVRDNALLQDGDFMSGVPEAQSTGAGCLEVDRSYVGGIARQVVLLLCLFLFPFAQPKNSVLVYPDAVRVVSSKLLGSNLAFGFGIALSCVCCVISCLQFTECQHCDCVVWWQEKGDVRN